MTLRCQDTAGLFTYSIVVVDNDSLRSAEFVVSKFSTLSSIPIKYCMEPRQNIALARNEAIRNSSGTFLAFIDDDEFPGKNWLLTLLQTCEQDKVDGVLGPVMPHFDEEPPRWIIKSKLYLRPIKPTGALVDWREARTGNVLLRKKILKDEAFPFRPEFRMGEDQDFFRRMMEKGCVFIWSADAVAYEVVPPGRWKRGYMLRKALLRGATARLQPNCNLMNILKSVIAVPIYAIALPVALSLGQHISMTLLVKLCDHLGKLLAVAGIDPIKGPYVTE